LKDVSQLVNYYHLLGYQDETTRKRLPSPARSPAVMVRGPSPAPGFLVDRWGFTTLITMDVVYMNEIVGVEDGGFRDINQDDAHSLSTFARMTCGLI
jgi:hypothetical protein